MHFGLTTAWHTHTHSIQQGVFLQRRMHFMFSPPPSPPLHSAGGFTFLWSSYFCLFQCLCSNICVFSLFFFGSSPSFILPLFMFHCRPLIHDHPLLLSDLPVDSHTARTEELLSATGMREKGWCVFFFSSSVCFYTQSCVWEHKEVAIFAIATASSFSW